MAELMVWMDMEMTGLSPEENVILEAVALITDEQLNEVASAGPFVVHQPDAILDGMDEWNTKQHGKSGLTAASRASAATVADVEEHLLEFVKDHVGERKSPLCGNSIHQDRAFLRRYMPALENYLHYRNIDVSTLKELVRRWYPDVPQFEKGDAHRALDDIRASIAELKYYRERVFRS